MSNVSDLKMEFLMQLQQQDYIKAQIIQKELLKLLPNDPTIRGFNKYLPDEVAYQKEAMVEDYLAEQNAEYESEDEYDEENSDEENDNQDKADNEKDAAPEKVEEEKPVFTVGPAASMEEKKEDDADNKSEYDSQYDPEDYDEEGNYIWGKEGEDWDFYYKEDKEAYEQGLSMVPEPLNPQALPEYEEMLNRMQEEEEMARKSTAASTNSNVSKVSTKPSPFSKPNLKARQRSPSPKALLAQDGAFYVTVKKKHKQATRVGGGYIPPKKPF